MVTTVSFPQTDSNIYTKRLMKEREKKEEKLPVLMTLSLLQCYFWLSQKFRVHNQCR